VPRLTFIRPPVSSSPRPPKGDDWLHEPKWDGFRFQIIKHGSDVRHPTWCGGRRSKGAHYLPAVACQKNLKGRDTQTVGAIILNQHWLRRLLKVAHRVARSSAYSRGQDQGWANPDDETRRSGGSFDGLGPLCFLCPPVRRRTITLEPGVASAVSNSLHSVHGRLPLC